jgi:hypothetical protein
MFLSDYANFALPKTYLQDTAPFYRSVTRNTHVRRINGGMRATGVSPSISMMQTTKPVKLQKPIKKVNPLKLKRGFF